MKIYSISENYKLYQGDMLDMAEVIKPNTIDAIVCDPPYELNFMGKGWDNAGISFQTDTWKKCYDALKPGGYLLAFGGSRTFHRIACAIESAGFEVRDTIMWLYGSGFPKSMSISKGIEAKEKLGNAGTRNKRKIEQSCDTEEYSIRQTNNGAMGDMIETTRKKYVAGTELAKQWQGWGTCLKPAYEPIIVARKPFKGSCVDNVIKYGVGGINIDECRVRDEKHKVNINDFSNQHGNKFGNGESIEKLGDREVTGRFPANVILDSQDGEDWRRYFYCAKASKKDRDEGLEEFEDEKVNDGRQTPIDNAFQREETLRKNTHPTVKPTSLMQYLVRLVTPKGGTVLDPFMGSGSTGKAVMYENKERNAGYKFIGIELTEEYLPIAEARIKYVEPLVDGGSNIVEREIV